MATWRIKALQFGNCNCDYGCPCQFNALPTHGNCQYAAGFHIIEGHHGDVRLDGLRCAAVGTWPGPVHEGGGTSQFIVDERADQAQQNALLRIMGGEDTEPMATMFAVYSAMTATFLDPLVKPIDLEVDIESGTARLFVDGIIDGSSEPIRNPVTGNVHRAQIRLPHGFEYEVAEVTSGTTKTTGGVALELNKSYGQLAELHLSNEGPVRNAL
ncbi:MAG: DUF1326 domain-containing protein [Trueperaceae bacterium]|nr:MAG: DUF1326 domain-containing protein [Trueperaceae bacterium]